MNRHRNIFIVFYPKRLVEGNNDWWWVEIDLHVATVLGISIQTPSPAFDLKIVYSHVIEVADCEFQLCFHCTAMVSEIFAFYHLKKNE